MTADKIRELDDKALDTQIKDLREQMFRLRFQIAMGQMEGLKKLRGLRKDRARILGVIRERQMAAAGK